MSPIENGDAARSARPEPPYRPGSGQVGLWSLLSMLCVCTPLGGALGAALARSSGAGRIVAAILIGTTLGVSGVLALDAAAERLVDTPGTSGEEAPRRTLVGLYLAKLLFLFLAPVAALWMTSWVLGSLAL